MLKKSSNIDDSLALFITFIQQYVECPYSSIYIDYIFSLLHQLYEILYPHFLVHKLGPSKG